MRWPGVTLFVVTVLAAAVPGSPADSPATILLREVSKKIQINSAALPNYTCVQNITRVQFAPRFGVRPAGGCAALAARRRETGRTALKVFEDRVRLDVAVVDQREMFAWAGAKQFETAEIDTLIPGTSGSGDFGSFLTAAFSRNVTTYTYRGEEDLDIGRLAKYLYEVPVARSRYQMRVGKTFATVGYRGTFYVDSEDADIRRLVIDADAFPPSTGVCSVEDTMDYRRVKMGDHDFLLPERSSMEVLYQSGQESLNQTQYSGCKQYVGESTIRFDNVDEQKMSAEEKKEAQIPLPPKLRIPVRLAGALDLYRAAAGDPITAEVDKDVIGKDASSNGKKVLLRAGSKLHGRLMRVEQDFPAPLPHWVIGIRFETIERAGQEQPVRLEALDDGLRSRQPQAYARMRAEIAALPRHEKNSGTGLFIFATAEDPKLDQTFHSEWQVSESHSDEPHR